MQPINLGLPPIDLGLPPIVLGLPTTDYRLPPVNLELPPLNLGLPTGGLAPVGLGATFVATLGAELVRQGINNAASETQQDQVEQEVKVMMDHKRI